MRYTIIEKETGKMYGGINMWDNTERPINPEILMYAVLTDSLIDAMTTHDKVVDIENTTFVNGVWDEHYITPDIVDITIQRQQDYQTFLIEAQRKLLIPDISESFKEKINDYILQLKQLNLSDTENGISWPLKPW